MFNYSNKKHDEQMTADSATFLAFCASSAQQKFCAISIMLQLFNKKHYEKSMKVMKKSRFKQDILFFMDYISNNFAVILSDESYQH